MTAAKATASRLDGIQAARAVAAILVVITHGIAHPLPGAPGVVHLLGRFGVTLFFVISGFIMVRSTGTGHFDPRRFISNRIRRVVPLYWLVCLILLGLVLIAPGLMKTTAFEPLHFAQSMLFIPAYHPSETEWVFPFFKLGWTLNYEMFFYLCFTLLFALRDVTRNVVLTLAFVALVILGQLVPFAGAAAHFYTRIDILAFVAGMWVAVADQRGVRPSGPLAAGLWVAAIASVAGIAWDYVAIKDIPWTQLWLIVACTILVALAARPRMRAPGWLRYAGDASYSIYLFHMFGVAAVTVVIHRLAPEYLYIGMAAAAAAGVVAGLLSYAFIEAPLNRWVRSLTRPKAAAPTPITPLTPVDFP